MAEEFDDGWMRGLKLEDLEVCLSFKFAFVQNNIVLFSVSTGRLASSQLALWHKTPPPSINCSECISVYCHVSKGYAI